MRLAFLSVVLWLFWGCDTLREPQDVEHNRSEEVTVSTYYLLTEIFDEGVLPTRSVRARSIDDLRRLFNAIGYNRQNIEEEVPRLYLRRLSCCWAEQTKRMGVAEKKELFFKLLLPSVLRANELILLERNRLLAHLGQPVDVEQEDLDWLIDLAKKYKVVPKERTSHVNDEELEMLLRRVDAIPPSLALAQAAEESGWGTSRFAIEGNALFGQWSFSKSAMTPKEQRSELGNYGLARFETPLDSILAYMHNLNSNRAYIKMRYKRQAMREAGVEVDALVLADFLDKYSERGREYTEGLKKMIRINRLSRFDGARLAQREVVYLLPPKRIAAQSENVPVGALASGDLHPL
ncbi:MAG: glucosaminidase domain-containing protein [Campylobacterales bacterium]|nr:glucosaminidase domain-containing protein [Campylobacterales bacterium]